MKTINLSQFDLTSDTNLKPLFGRTIPGKIAISETSTNVLKLNDVNVVMDDPAIQALSKLKEKYKENPLTNNSSN